MEIKEFMAQYPDAKDNPLKFAVDSLMIKYHFTKSERADIENSIILQDFVVDANLLVKEINNYGK